MIYTPSHTFPKQWNLVKSVMKSFCEKQTSSKRPENGTRNFHGQETEIYAECFHKIDNSQI